MRGQPNEQEGPLKSITVNRSVRLRDEPSTGHNRWHPDVAPVIAADVGEEVVLETCDASDGHVVYKSEAEAHGPSAAVPPLTVPACVQSKHC